MSHLLATAVLVAGLLGALSDPASASGVDASKVIAQSGNFTTAYSGATASRLNQPGASVLDSTRHRFFIADTTLHRVLIFNLNSDNSFPDETADYVLGQPDFSGNTSGVSASKFNKPGGMAYDPIRDLLYVTDLNNNRVLVFDTGSLSNGKAASYVLGQPNFTSTGAAVTQSGLGAAEDVALDGSNRYLYVADSNARRVMVWDTTTLSSSMNAAYVIGQSGFTGTTYAITQTTTFFPFGVAVDPSTNKLFVAEGAGNRVTVFDLNSLANGLAASWVLGQSSFTTNNTGLSQTAMSDPRKVAAGAGRVYVTDFGNQRVLVFDSSNTSNGQSAIGVYGQPNYTSSSVNNGGRSASSVAYPNSVTFDRSSLKMFLADSGNNRILVFNPFTSTLSVNVSIEPSFTFTVSGKSGTCNGAASTPGSSSSGSAVSLGRINAANSMGAQDLVVTTNAGNGFTVYMRSTGSLTWAGRNIAAVSGTNAAPAAFPSAGTEAFGYTTSDATLATGTANRFTNAGPNWAASTTSDAEVSASSSAASIDTVCVAYRAGAGSTTAAGAYSTTVIYTAAPRF